VRIRSWHPGDFEELHALDCACFPPPVAYSRRTLRKFLRLPGADCLVAECGYIAGFILTHAASFNGRDARTPPRGHIISLDVDAQFRRHGVGSALLHAAEESMASCGVHTIDLETAVDNHPAISFWLRHGYEIVGKIADYYDDGVDAFVISQTMARATLPAAPRTLHHHQSEESDSPCTYTRPSFSPSSKD
jgi:ribosomal-protein-alanine N-acetyltransferase